MKITLSDVREKARSDQGRRMIRYTMVSIISVAVAQVLLALAFGVLKWSATWSNVFAVGVSAIPSYYLNRAWAWGKSGRSHFWKEIVPFWVIALLSTLFASWTVSETGHHVNKHHVTGQALILAAYLGGFAILWLVKYVIYHKVLFIDHHPGQADSLEAPLPG